MYKGEKGFFQITYFWLKLSQHLTSGRVLSLLQTLFYHLNTLLTSVPALGKSISTNSNKNVHLQIFYLNMCFFLDNSINTMTPLRLIANWLIGKTGDLETVGCGQISAATW